MELCFSRIRADLRMPDENLHFLAADKIDAYTRSYDEADCLVMQGV
jgi:hypothetical protein